MVTDKTIVIPGHGPIGNKSQLIEYRDVLRHSRPHCCSQKEGKSLNEMKWRKAHAAYDAKWGGFFFSLAARSLRKLVYQRRWERSCASAHHS